VAGGLTEYKTITTVADCHPEEFMDFLLVSKGGPHADAATRHKDNQVTLAAEEEADTLLLFPSRMMDAASSGRGC
jgi:hypothetical protein